jgi:hypothetical protein
MNKLTPLLLLASVLTGSCSSTYAYRGGPLLNVGDSRITLSGTMSDAEFSGSDNAGGSYSTYDVDRTSMDVTLGQMVIENLELGGMLSIENETGNDGLGGNKSSADLMGLSAYGRFYIPSGMPGGLVPWIQAEVLFYGRSSENSSGVISGDSFASSGEGELFGTALSVGVTSFVSANAAIEFAIRTRAIEADSWTGTTTTLGSTTSTHADGYVRERDSTDFTLGVSLIF